MNLIEFIPNTDVKSSPVGAPELLKDIQEIQPVPASKVIPSWYKRLSANVEPEARTIKSCRPVHELIHTGYILPLWADHEFRWAADGQEITAVSPHTQAGHPGPQLGEQLHTNLGYQSGAIKFISPWIIKTPPGYSCLFMKPFFHFEDRFTVMPAIVNTDKYDEMINFPALVMDDIPVPFTVDIGYPLVHIIPFKRESWKSKVSELTKAMFNKKGTIRYYLLNRAKHTYHKFCKVNPSFK